MIISEKLIFKTMAKGNTLSLAAGQLMRFTPGKLGHMNQVEQLIHFFPDFFFWEIVLFQAVDNILFNRHMRAQGIRLKHHIDRAFIGYLLVISPHLLSFGRCGGGLAVLPNLPIRPAILVCLYVLNHTNHPLREAVMSEKGCR